MKKIAIALYGFLFVVLLATSCTSNELVEPELEKDNTSSSLGNFEIETVSSTARELLLEWTMATNAVRYEVIVNDTIRQYDVQKKSCLLKHLKPNTTYKVSVRAYDKNNFVKIVSKNVQTISESANEITALSFDKYEYQKINITHCKVTKDNNYIILGDAIIFGKAYKLVMKTDRNFNTIWKYYYQGGNFDYMAEGQDIKECCDGGFLIISLEFIFKVSKDGHIVYQKKYAITNAQSWVDNGIETTNGNFLLAGNHYWMLNTNSDTLWVKKSNDLLVTDLIQNDAGTYFVYGYKRIGVNSYDEEYNIRLVEIDNSGNELNENIYPISDACYSMYLLQSKDNGYYLLSHSTFSGNYITTELCITKTDNRGKELWTSHTYPQLKIGMTVNSAKVLPDNSLLCLCYEMISQYYYVCEISNEGKITKTFRAGDMYVPIFVDKDENGTYKILTQGGYVYKLVSER